jgi:hypothetical protein
VLGYKWGLNYNLACDAFPYSEAPNESHALSGLKGLLSCRCHAPAPHGPGGGPYGRQAALCAACSTNRMPVLVKTTAVAH